MSLNNAVLKLDINSLSITGEGHSYTSIPVSFDRARVISGEHHLSRLIHPPESLLVTVSMTLNSDLTVI